MVRRNPYSVGADLKLYLRSASGSFATWSKAKSFEIRRDGVLLYYDEFDYVSFSKSLKEEIVNEAIRDIFIEDRGEPEVPEELEDQAKEQEKLSNEMLFDLLEILKTEDPQTYTELTGEVTKLPGIKYRQEPFDVFSQIFEEYLIGEKIWGTLDEPISISSPDLTSLGNIINANLKPYMIDAYNMAQSGDNLMILRVTYQSKKKAGKKVSLELSGFSLRRREIMSEKEFIEYIEEMIAEFKKAWQGYLKEAFNNTIEITGFTLENVITTA